MSTMTYAGTLVIDQCYCGIQHAIPHQLQKQAAEDGKGIYCPLGHKWFYAETVQQKLEREQQARREAEQRIRATRELLHAEERSHAATRGHLTRHRKRAQAGVCPVQGCKRHFQDLERHIASKHPDYAKAHS
jgi:DNA repair exonuclease SbcCD ATPase subunit